MKMKCLTLLTLGLGVGLTASADLVHRYSFNDPAGSLTATDSVGGLSWSATLNGQAALDGSQLVLDGSGSFAELPGGVITNTSAVTVETWASFGLQNADWARVFDIGAMDSGGAVISDFRIEPRAPGNYVDSFYGTPDGAYVNHPQGWDNQTNVHIVVVLNPSANILAVYTNGVLISSPPSGPLPPLSSFTNTLSYLGKSFYSADPYLIGTIDEFRVWNQALSQAQIEASFEAGPNNVSTNPGALTSIQLSLTQPVISIGLGETAVLNGFYANLTNAVNLTGSAGIVYTSGNTNVLTISTNGTLLATGAGATSVIAAYQGLSATQSVTVVQNYLAPSHRYSFNDAPGATVATDSIGGAAWNGTLFGDAVITNGQLVLHGTDGYMDLPAQIIGNGKAVTVEAWASFGVQSRDWSRVFSFGSLDAQNNPSEQFRLSPRAGGNYVDLNYQGADANHPQGWDNQTNLHIVAVANPPSSFLGIYANGVLIGQNTSASTPLSPAPDQLSYVGKSLYPADPFLIGSISEFRIYEGALSPDRIAIDTAAGPDNLVTNAGSLQSAQLVIPSQIHLGESVHAFFAGKFQNVSNVDLFLYGAPVVSSSDTNVFTIGANGQLTAVATGTATLKASFGSFNTSQAVTVAPAVLTHRYSFKETAGTSNVTDSVGGAAWNGTLNGSAALDGTNLVLDGVNGYVQLPAQIIGGYSALTVEAWVNFGANANWTRLWDFGDQNSGGGGNSSAYFTPHNGGGGSQLTMFKPGGGVDVALSTNLDNSGEMQVAGVYTGNSMDLYYNGVLVGHSVPSNVALTDVIDANSYIGKSMFDPDPYLTGTVDEFRIYQGALKPSQITADFASGPNAVPTAGPKLSIGLTNNTITLTWPSGGNGYILQSSSTVSGGWANAGLSVTVQNGQNVATDTVSGKAKFYRLQRGP
jgi:hypothetical protein